MAIPTGVVGCWDLTKCTPKQIQDDTRQLITDLGKLADQSGSVPLDQVTYETVVKVVLHVQHITYILFSSNEISSINFFLCTVLALPKFTNK